MGVLMIRAGENASVPPETVIVLESEVKAYEAEKYVRVATDPAPEPPPPRPRFNGLNFLSGSTGE
jgi:hypothetical protein